MPAIMPSPEISIIPDGPIIDWQIHTACDVALGPLCRDKEGKIDTIIHVDRIATLNAANFLVAVHGVEQPTTREILFIATHSETIKTIYDHTEDTIIHGLCEPGEDDEPITVRVGLTSSEGPNEPSDVTEIIERMKQDKVWRKIEAKSPGSIKKCAYEILKETLPYAKKGLRHHSLIQETAFHEMQHAVEEDDPVVAFEGGDYSDKPRRKSASYDTLVIAGGSSAITGVLFAAKLQDPYFLEAGLGIGALTFVGSIYKAIELARLKRRSDHKIYLDQPNEIRARVAGKLSEDQAPIITFEFKQPPRNRKRNKH